jgi:DNA-directed RNA polymerase specialized sigma subunit
LWFKKAERASNYFSLSDEEGGDKEFGAYDDDLKVHEEKEMQFDQLTKAMDQLGEPCSSLLKAFYQDKKNMQEIAELFRYTNAENAKTQKYKCLTRLRKIFFTAAVKAKS